ncbi:ATP-dependent nuclease [Vibrio crassostreae]|uniref:ATP-dependent nuclease n=1 Tax=Vibrio crassostreae TaxID=246167 RepID=UPI001B3126C5|nr:putative ATP-dependent endonuclease of the OLD family [Vibrio crassostreae]CAK2547629.1 putative ATP-dependent endonuclease of the OLD family [Vibrio crassostreae]CAK3297222.1 putative ATP-dependent endonuclease of the OLD family [Vibrio crassostreae]
MHISKVKIENFRNFHELEIETDRNMVIVGENKVGKSNFLFSLRLILDPSLSELEHFLSLDDFWDGLGPNKLGNTVKVSLDVKGINDSPATLAVLADGLIDVATYTAKITYEFKPKSDTTINSINDYEYNIYLGNSSENSIPRSLRRCIQMELFHALRDCERELNNSNRTPIKSFLDQISDNLTEPQKASILAGFTQTQTALDSVPNLGAIEQSINTMLQTIVGTSHVSPVQLKLAPQDINKLVKSLKLLIDSGLRTISQSSTGSSNILFLTLKLLKLQHSMSIGEQEFTFLAIEEPEAHLHPHVQRLLFDYFYNSEANINTLLTTHSPHIASTAPISSLIVLKEVQDGNQTSTKGYSLANSALSPEDIEDMSRYLTVTRGEVLFARGVILVEGDAEEFLIPELAKKLGFELDKKGISICSVAGTNFAPYVKFLKSIGTPFTIITDRDPLELEVPLGVTRIDSLLDILVVNHTVGGSEQSILALGQANGIFTNTQTLETELVSSPVLKVIICDILLAEHGDRQRVGPRITAWRNNQENVDIASLLRYIGEIGKGRFAKRLSNQLPDGHCPLYITSSFEYIYERT